MQGNDIDISIVIVSYKTPRLLKDCLQSIIDTTTQLIYEIIVIDNDSGDESEELIKTHFPQVKWINSGYNAGFSRANNLGFRNAMGTYTLILNPDTTLKEGFLRQLLSFYLNQNEIFKNKLGFLTTRIISSTDQSLLIGTGRKFVGFRKEMNKNPFVIFFKRMFRLNPVKYDPYVQHYLNHEVDFVSGACFLIKTSTLKENDLFFDEDFFLYFEDLELCFRTKQIGLRNYFCGDLELFHVNSASTSQSKSRNEQIKISEYLFYNKRFNRLQFNLLGYLIQFNLFLNMNLLKRKKEFEQIELLHLERELFNTYYFHLDKHLNKGNQQMKSFLKYDQKVKI